jgi:lysophospholipase L1-like esterase
MIMGGIQIKIWILLLIKLCYSCVSDTDKEGMPPITGDKPVFSYIALGDSYTKGEDIPSEGSFPRQLEKRLISAGYTREKDVRVIAQTGWTCDNLYKSVQAAAIENNAYRLVTLLAGVNDQYQRIPIQFYPERFGLLVDEAIRISGNKDRVVILSIPDYSVTPFAKGSNTEKIASELKQYNDINRGIAENRGIKYVDITGISLKAKDDLSYLADDKVHPSAKMYEEWVTAMWDTVREALKP